MSASCADIGFSRPPYMVPAGAYGVGVDAMTGVGR
jgi:hypothetical protein